MSETECMDDDGGLLAEQDFYAEDCEDYDDLLVVRSAYKRFRAS